MIINKLRVLKTPDELRSIFSQIDDPRSDINKLHKLEDILLIGIISVICAADTWKNMESFPKGREMFLRSFLELPNGIPSDDTFNRVFSSIDSDSAWINMHFSRDAFVNETSVHAQAVFNRYAIIIRCMDNKAMEGYSLSLAGRWNKNRLIPGPEVLPIRFSRDPIWVHFSSMVMTGYTSTIKSGRAAKIIYAIGF